MIGETRWFWNSSRILLLSAPLTKFRSEKVTNAEESFNHTLNLNFYLLIFHFSARNFVSGTDGSGISRIGRKSSRL